MPNNYQNKRASILILALWSVCFLTSMAVILSASVRQKLMLVSRLEERQELKNISEAGIKKAIIEINREELTGVMALKDLWSNNPIVFKDISVGEGRFNVCYDILGPRGEVITRWGMVDESRKINLNTADMTVIKRLFQVVLEMDEVSAQELAASVVDWRDADNLLSIPLGSAEDQYYMGLKYPYKAKNADFETLDELLLVKGMTQDIFTKLRNYVTIYGSGKVNVNTASKQVLMALGLREEIADRVITFRSGEDKLEGTIDDSVFDSALNVGNKLAQAYQLRPADVAQINLVADRFLCTDSNVFMARSLARLNNKKNTTETISVFDRLGRILYWREF